jgi:hypothetical protein
MRPVRRVAELGSLAVIARAMNKPEPSALMLEIGAKFYPRRYRRFRDLRPSEEASQWARSLDWRENPYDRFLLRRELLRHIESTEFYEGRWNVFTFASREEIAAEVEHLMDEFPDEYEFIGVFSYVLITLRWNLGFKHGLIRYSRLSEALAKLPVNEKDK